MKSPFFLLLLAFLAVGCADDPLPEVTTNDALREQLRGTWLPVSLTIRYQVGVTPNQRDTVVTLTPTTAPLLVASRPNPIMAFTDTLTFAASRTPAQPDSFFVANRGIRQRGYYFVATPDDASAGSLLRIGVPTRGAAGRINRWAYDVVIHGEVSLGTGNRPSYASVTYPNYPFTLRSLTDNQLVLSLTPPANLSNLPLVPITPQNINNTTTYGGRPALLTATFQRR